MIQNGLFEIYLLSFVRKYLQGVFDNKIKIVINISGDMYFYCLSHAQHAKYLQYILFAKIIVTS